MGICFKSSFVYHITVCIMVLLFDRFGDLWIRLRLGFVYNVAVSIFIETSYIVQIMKGIFCRERLIVAVHSGPVAILCAQTLAVNSFIIICITEHTTQLLDSSATLFRVAKQIFSLPNTEVMVRVQPLQASLHYFSSHPEVLKRRVTLFAFGVDHTVLYMSVHILAANFSTKPTSVPCYIVVATETDSPEMVVHFCPDNISPQKRRRRPWVYSLSKRGKLPIHQIEKAERKMQCSVCVKISTNFRNLYWSSTSRF